MLPTTPESQPEIAEYFFPDVRASPSTAPVHRNFSNQPPQQYTPEYVVSQNGHQITSSESVYLQSCSDGTLVQDCALVYNDMQSYDILQPVHVSHNGQDCSGFISYQPQFSNSTSATGFSQQEQIENIEPNSYPDIRDYDDYMMNSNGQENRDIQGDMLLVNNDDGGNGRFDSINGGQEDWGRSCSIWRDLGRGKYCHS